MCVPCCCFLIADGTQFSWTEEDVNNLYSANVFISSDGIISLYMCPNIITIFKKSCASLTWLLRDLSVRCLLSNTSAARTVTSVDCVQLFTAMTSQMHTLTLLDVS